MAVNPKGWALQKTASSNRFLEDFSASNAAYGKSKSLPMPQILTQIEF